MIEFIGYREGNVIDTTQADDYLKYPKLQEFSENEIGFIRTDANFNPFVYNTIKVINNEVITT
jgi:hypothetical protein